MYRKSRAYPRSRGGTLEVCPKVPPLEGLSPLARGNRLAGSRNLHFHGPIPARAGEPSSGRSWGGITRAYPRSRGGTCTLPSLSSSSWGLSPLARGNPDTTATTAAAVGPIPARAGEPRRGPALHRIKGAYPRSRGGTPRKGRMLSRSTGLSPLARGNPQGPAAAARPPGPIPARAGEPRPIRRSRSQSWAYPRSRGGTAVTNVPRFSTVGLSPLARGNPVVCGDRLGVNGPIPARAGEPSSGRSWADISRAYPRSRGGTSHT